MSLAVAEKACVDEGHPALFGHRLTEPGVTADTLTGVLLPPQAINRPSNTRAKHRPVTTEYLDTFRPASPSITTPAIGTVNGSQGRRLPARRGARMFAAAVFGPEVVMVSDTEVDPFVAGIDAGLKIQLVVASSPEQAYVIVAPKDVAGATGVTVKL